MTHKKTFTTKTGFTLLEVSLFLALSGILLVGIISSTRHNLARQRYNNAVQEYAEFLRGLYSSTIYTQNTSETNGRSDNAIYGKLVIFGNTEDIYNPSIVYTYDIIGRAINSTDSLGISTLQPIEMLKDLDKIEKIRLENLTTYQPKWGASIRNTDGSLYTGALLIFRSPILGTIFTYSSTDPNLTIDNINFQESNFDNRADVDFCIDSDDRQNTIGSSFQDIRIISPAHNSSAVSLINVDSNADQGGNRCANT